MRKLFFGLVVGAFLGSLGVVVAQTPTIFAAIRVNGTSDLRGAISNGTGSVAISDALAVDSGGGADELTVGTDLTTITNLTVTGTCTGCGGSSFPLLAPNGSAMAPSYSFSNSTMSGMFLLGGTELWLTTDDGMVLSAANSVTLDGASTEIESQLNVNFDAGIGLNVNSADEMTAARFSANTGRISLEPWSADMFSELRFLDLDDNPGIGRVSGDSLTLESLVNDLTLESAGTLLVNASGGTVWTGAIDTPNTSAAEPGWKGIPQNPQTADYTLVLTDAANQILHEDGGGAGDTFTIPAEASVDFPIGTVVTFINADSNDLEIAITSDSMFQAGTTTAGPFTLSENGIATAVKIASALWIINGTGLSP